MAGLNGPALSVVVLAAVVVTVCLAGVASAAEAPAPTPTSGSSSISPPMAAIAVLFSAAAFLPGFLRQ